MNKKRIRNSKQPEKSSLPEVLEPEVLPADTEYASEIVDEFGKPAVSTDANLENTEVEVLPAEDLVIESDEVSSEEGFKASTPEHKELVRYDALSAYLREISRIPRITKEEEQQLGVRYKETNDLEAAYKLIQSNLWLVVKIARDYERAARSLLDLIQEGNIGMLEAVKNFDPYRGVRFPSYASWWIKAYIIRYVIANWRMVKIGTTQAQRKLFFNLQREKEKLEKQGIYPGPKLLAQNLKVKENEVVEMQQRLGAGDLSIDAPLHPDSETPFLAALPAEQMSAEDLFAHKQSRELLSQGIAEFLKTLNPKEQVILKERLLDEDKATLQDLAEKLSLSRERIRQLENRIKEKLKAFFEKKYGTVIDTLDL